jgi:hypothetical protein
MYLKFISQLRRYSVNICTLPATSVMRARWEAVRQSFPSVMLLQTSLHCAPTFFFKYCILWKVGDAVHEMLANIKQTSDILPFVCAKIFTESKNVGLCVLVWVAKTSLLMFNGANLSG